MASTTASSPSRESLPAHDACIKSLRLRAVEMGIVSLLAPFFEVAGARRAGSGIVPRTAHHFRYGGSQRRGDAWPRSLLPQQSAAPSARRAPVCGIASADGGRRDQGRSGAGTQSRSSRQSGPTPANRPSVRPLMSMLDSPWSTRSLTTLPVAGAMPKPWADAVTTT